MFRPGSNDPAQLDLAMRASLAGSLTYLQSAVGTDLGVSARDVARASAEIERHRIEPGLFGRYYKLVLAIESGQHDAARDIFRQIISRADHTPALAVKPYTVADLGDDRQVYGDLIENDPTTLPWLAAPAPTIDFRDRVLQSLAIIERIDGPLARELGSLIVQIVGASPSHLPGVQSFGSASSFMLWGLVVFNVERYRTVLEIIPALVHEAAHLLLFAHSIEEPLVTNSIDARYTSPLRTDPRPMDGVFHATFVAARMFYVTQQLRRATGLDLSTPEVDRLDRNLVELRGQYAAGMQTIAQHGMLTATGERILNETRDYMRAA